ncbi:MAG: hypothetical protein ACOC2W_03310 [bacterium]
MFETNMFWEIVKEIYPLFLEICMLGGLYRLCKGGWNRLQGDSEAIGKALNDIIVAFFWLHMSIPIVSLVWVILTNISNSAETIIKMIE